MVRRRRAMAMAGAIVATVALGGGYAAAGVNVNETGNSVLCKGKSCDWLKPACKKEGGTYTEGAGGTGKCNFPATADVGFTAKPAPTAPAQSTKPMKQ